MSERDAYIRFQLTQVRAGRSRQLRCFFVGSFGYCLILAIFLAMGNFFWSGSDGTRWPFWFGALIILSMGAGLFILAPHVKKESADKIRLREALASTPTCDLIAIANEAPPDGRYVVMHEVIARAKMQDELARAFLFRHDLNGKSGSNRGPICRMRSQRKFEWPRCAPSSSQSLLL